MQSLLQFASATIHYRLREGMIAFILHRIPRRITASPVYVRLHGDPAPGGDYSSAMLESWAGRIRAWHGQSPDVFLYFNNDFEGYAVNNAILLKKMLGLN
jgi:uncharacterized protein YecE (DUF72 family)